MVALITGGSRGIGFGIAKALAAEGLDLAINGMRPEENVSTVLDELKSHGVRVIYCQGNVASQEDRTRILEKIKAELGGLNFLINNAGVAPKERNDILNMTEESYDFVMDINLKGTYFLTQASANWMIAQSKAEANFTGGIINVSSISATMASVNRGEYCISKAGMSMLTQLFAVRLGEYEIPVFEIRPGVIATDMTSGVKGKYDKLISEGLSVQKRWGTPSDCGKACAALVKGSFPFSTGQVIMIDGGLTLARL